MVPRTRCPSSRRWSRRTRRPAGQRWFAMITIAIPVLATTYHNNVFLARRLPSPAASASSAAAATALPSASATCRHGSYAEITAACLAAPVRGSSAVTSCAASRSRTSRLRASAAALRVARSISVPHLSSANLAPRLLYRGAVAPPPLSLRSQPPASQPRPAPPAPPPPAPPSTPPPAPARRACAPGLPPPPPC